MNLKELKTEDERKQGSMECVTATTVPSVPLSSGFIMVRGQGEVVQLYTEILSEDEAGQRKQGVGVAHFPHLLNISLGGND